MRSMPQTYSKSFSWVHSWSLVHLLQYASKFSQICYVRRNPGSNHLYYSYARKKMNIIFKNDQNTSHYPPSTPKSIKIVKNGTFLVMWNISTHPDSSPAKGKKARPQLSYRSSYVTLESDSPRFYAITQGSPPKSPIIMLSTKNDSRVLGRRVSVIFLQLVALSLQGLKFGGLYKSIWCESKATNK